MLNDDDADITRDGWHERYRNEVPALQSANDRACGL